MDAIKTSEQRLLSDTWWKISHFASEEWGGIWFRIFAEIWSMCTSLQIPRGIWPSSKQRGEKSDQILGKSGFEIQPQLLFSSHTLLSSNSKQWPSLELLKNSTSTITISALNIFPSSKLKIVSLSSFVDSVGLLGHSLQKVGLPSGVKEVVNTGDSRTKLLFLL